MLYPLNMCMHSTVTKDFSIGEDIFKLWEPWLMESPTLEQDYDFYRISTEIVHICVLWLYFLFSFLTLVSLEKILDITIQYLVLLITCIWRQIAQTGRKWWGHTGWRKSRTCVASSWLICKGIPGHSRVVWPPHLDQMCQCPILRHSVVDHLPWVFSTHTRIHLCCSKSYEKIWKLV